MPPTIIRSPPVLDSFVSLEEHQSQTPASFFGAKPVLHHHVIGALALTSRDQIPNLAIFRSASGASHGGSAGTESSFAGQEAVGEGLGNMVEALGLHGKAVEAVDVYVSSENFTLYNDTLSTGVTIPYPSITLHAIQRILVPGETEEVPGLYMQLELEMEAESTAEDEEPSTVELTILPSASSMDSSSYLESTKTLYEAISACSNLHPDPISQEDEDMLDEDGDSRIVFEGNVGYEGISGLPGVVRGASDGGLPPPFPGSGGWITAENVGEYFDEEGNWLGDGEEQEEEPLGEGAGRVRRRDEVEVADETGNGVTRVNGHRPDDEEGAKRVRMD